MGYGQKIVIHIHDEDIFNNTANFKNHRDYIQHRFMQIGYMVTRWNWERNPTTGQWNPDKNGLQFKRDDSDAIPSLEITGVVGKNLRKIP